MSSALHDIRTLVLQVLGTGGLGARQASAPESAATELSRWIDLVERWNARVDLTAARSVRELVDLAVADAAVIAPMLSPNARVVDVGTGAGAPGMGIAILRPDTYVTLVEPLAKRVAFLRTVIGTLRTPNVRVLRARGEDVTECFDVAVSRATLPPPQWLALGTKLAPEGSVVVLLARETAPEMDGWSAKEDVGYVWPLTGVARRLVRYGR